MLTLTSANAETQANQLFAPRPNIALLCKVAAGLVVLTCLWIFRQPVLDLLAAAKNWDALADYMHGLGNWGPALLGATIALQVTFAVIPGHLLMLAGGYLYGFWPGVFITWTALVAASQVNFWLARSAGRPVVYRLAPAAILDRWRAIADGKGFVFFLMVFVVPIFPSDTMAYVAGFTTITPRQYTAANILGHLPCALVMSFVGAHGLAMPPQLWVPVVVLSLLAVGLWRLYGDRLEQRLGLN